MRIKTAKNKTLKAQQTLNFQGFSFKASAGFEPADRGVADLCLTTWLRRHININKSSPSRIRTYDPPVNSRLLYRWAIEDYLESGSHLLSQAVSNQVSSADCVLTFVFGMGTGVPHNRITTGNIPAHSKVNKEFLEILLPLVKPSAY